MRKWALDRGENMEGRTTKRDRESKEGQKSNLKTELGFCKWHWAIFCYISCFTAELNSSILPVQTPNSITTPKLLFVWCCWENTTMESARGLSQREQDIQMMLAADVHLGTKNCDFQMERYIHKRRSDGLFLFHSHFFWVYSIFVEYPYWILMVWTYKKLSLAFYLLDIHKCSFILWTDLLCWFIYV